MYEGEDEEAYLEAREQERVETAKEQVALAEREAPQDLVELKANFTKQQLLDVVAERAFDSLFGRYSNEGMDREVRKHVHAMVEAAAREEIEKHVSGAIGEATAKILAEGFQQTDSYGNARGERKTVAAFVLEYLQAKGDSYNSSKARIYETADKLVSDYLEKHIAPELVKLKKRCVDALDASVTGKIREAVIAGLGLKA